MVSSQDQSGGTDFFVWMVDQADLSPAARLATKAAKGRYVYAALRETADRSQASLRAYLDQHGVSYQSSYITDAILVHGGDLTLALSLAARPDVARITADHPVKLPAPEPVSNGPAQVTTVEPNLTFIRADQAWALGITGQGSVLAAIDTGIQWNHPALIDHYRGWNGMTADHNYNWWDATGQYPSAPADGNGHGTMVTGVMVGDDGASNQIGVAPGAKMIHCKAISDFGGGTEADFLECFQWILAPWDLAGGNPRPDLAPDALNNSWGGAGGYTGYETSINALQAAGILVEAASGGEGPGCGSVGSPGDYGQILTTGGVDQTGGVLPGVMSAFSARGPSILDPLSYVPDVVAPAIHIRSSYPANSYQVWDGTSLAGPHVTGLVGLIWSANPLLRGNIEATVQIIDDTAVPLTGQQGSHCGGDYITGPNNDWGYGTIDALAAVESAMYFGNWGNVQGQVQEEGTQSALADVEIQAIGVQEWFIETNSLGLYSMRVPSGTYTMTATHDGYATEIITDVAVISGMVTTQDFGLFPLSVTISGTVTDANTHQPLEATIEVSGGLITETTSEGASGFYSFTLTSYRAYTLTAQSPGYGVVRVAMGLLSGNARQDFALPAGRLGVEPLALQVELISGHSLTLPITLTNTGGMSLTFEISPTASWLAVSLPTGTLPGGEVLALSVEIDTAGLPSAGVYTTTLILETDTPYNPVNLPVRLTVVMRYDIYLPFLIYPSDT